jgi:flagellar hook-associated protein 2
MGISFNKDGTLSLDESKLKEALSENYDAVAGFFLGYEKEGYSGRIGGVLTNLGEAMKGLTDPLRNPVKSAMDGLNSSISSLQKNIEDYERRLQSVEDRLYAQFSAADEALRLMSVTLASISSSLSSLTTSS